MGTVGEKIIENYVIFPALVMRQSATLTFDYVNKNPEYDGK